MGMQGNIFGGGYTAEEVERFKSTLAEMVCKVEALKEEKKEMVAGYNDSLKEYQDRILKLAQAIEMARPDAVDNSATIGVE